MNAEQDEDAARYVSGVEQMRRWVDEFPEQIRRSLEQARATDWPGRALLGSSDPPRSLLLGGMGGSGMAARLAFALGFDRLLLPFVAWQDPEIPRWLGPEDLAGVVSYSGETWEAVEMYRASRARGARGFVVATGGVLTRQVGFDPSTWFAVPAGYAPRAALGWMLVPVLLVAASAPDRSGSRWVADELTRAADVMEEEISLWQAGRALEGRDPVALAQACLDKMTFVYAPSQRYHPAAQRFKAQLQENGKQMAAEGAFPELTHNEVVGWHFACEKLAPVFFFLEDGSLRESSVQVMEAARKELHRAGGDLVRIPCRGKGPVADLLSHILLADSTSVELARLRGIDPLPVEAIGRVKMSLRKERST